MIRIWHTEHPINQTVTSAVLEGMVNVGQDHRMDKAPRKSVADSCISYGILRGTGKCFKACEQEGVDYWEIDKGYFNAGHYDGYYRISRNGLQCRYDDSIAMDLDSSRLSALDVEMRPWKQDRPKRILVCPPTDFIKHYEPNATSIWWSDIITAIHTYKGYDFVIRHKESEVDLYDDIANSYVVVTFNSNVAIDALRAGVPAITGKHSAVYHWNKLTLDDLDTDLTRFSREKFFRFLSYCQFTLKEFATGEAWRITKQIQRHSQYSLDGTDARMWRIKSPDSQSSENQHFL